MKKYSTGLIDLIHPNIQIHNVTRQYDQPNNILDERYRPLMWKPAKMGLSIMSQMMKLAELITYLWRQSNCCLSKIMD